MDRIEQMRAFATVVAHGSFTAAAHRLQVTPQQVSKYVKALEEDVRARLLHRTTRAVRPTETGRAFYERAVRLIDEFDELRASAREDHGAPRGRLRLTAPATFGERHLAPILAAFLEAYPEMSVDLHLTDRFVGLIDEGFDLAVRIGALDDSGLVARRIGDAPLRLCAAPEFLAQGGSLDHPQALAERPCIIDANLRDADQWRFVVDGAAISVRVSGRVRANSAAVVRRLALAGAGFALCPAYAVDADIARGALVSLFEGAIGPTFGLFALYPTSRHLSGKTRLFVDFLAQAWKASKSAG